MVAGPRGNTPSVAEPVAEAKKVEEEKEESDYGEVTMSLFDWFSLSYLIKYYITMVSYGLRFLISRGFVGSILWIIECLRPLNIQRMDLS